MFCLTYLLFFQKTYNIIEQIPNVTIAKGPVKSICMLHTKLKHKHNKLLHFHVVYNILCQNCEKKYVGQISQLLKTRLALHKSIRLFFEMVEVNNEPNNY